MSTILDMEEEALSHGQRSLWFLHHLAPGAAAYNIAAASRLLTPVDPEALERALQALVDRHAALRTAFPSISGEPRQRVAPSRKFALACEDATGWSEERLRSRLAEEAWRPFDLEQGPLLRVNLWTGGPGGPVVLLVIHHIIADFWSLALLMRELPVLYRGDQLPPPGLAYAEHVRLEREMLADGRGEALLAWWRERLAGLPTLELATDRPRPAVQTWRGDCRRLRLPGELAAALRAFSRARHGTLFMTLAAAFQALLSRHSGQEDLAIGTPRAGRSSSRTAGTVGYFVNQVVLRGDLGGDPTFAELLERTKAMVQAAFEHGDIPLPLLAEHLQPERDASRTPLFQVSFVLQKETRGAEGLTAYALGEEGVAVGPEDFRLESMSLPRPPALFDLVLQAVERQGGLSLALQLNTDLFDGTTADRLLDQFERLLEGIAADPAHRLSELPLLSEAERAQLVVEWNDTAVEEPREPLVHELVLEQARRRPEALAVAAPDERITYGELASRARQLAAALGRLGVGPEVRVALCAGPTVDRVVGSLAVLAAGGAYVLLDPKAPVERLAFQVADSGAAVVLAEELGRFAGSAVPVASLKGDGRWRPSPGGWGGDGRGVGGEVSAANLAYIVYTSGSTGQPKGVAVPHAGLLNLVRWHQATHGAGPDDRTTLIASPAFDASVWELWSALAAGASVHIPDRETRLSPVAIVRYWQSEGITWSFLPTPLAEEVMAAGVPQGLPLKGLQCGGDRLHQVPPGLPFPLINLYGPSEVSVLSTAAVVAPDPAGVPPIGRPIHNIRTCVVDPRGALMPRGAVGELWLGGAGLARGYLGQPALTAERFVPDPWSGEAGERLYRTGDLVRHRPDGNLEFLGRLDHQVKLRGFRIEPGEIEAALREHPAVRQAAVVVRGEPRRLVAYVAGDGGAAPTHHELREHLRERLPSYMVPAVFVSLPALPLTTNGKLDRRALPEPPLEERLAPRTPAEERMAAVFAAVLGVGRIGVEDSFFEHGGHSLAAMRLIAHVREAFGVDLPLHRVFETPTVAALAREIEGAAQAGPQQEPVERVPRDGRLPLSFAQERLWFLDQLQPGSVMYNVPVAIRLNGALDRAALAAAFGAIVRRHEVLRTVFRVMEGQPSQIVTEPAGFALPLVDLQGLPEPEREAARLADEEARRPFDLRHGPLLRMTLLRLGGRRHTALLTMHHIVSDGWSLGVLVRELGALYGARPLPELPIQYADFAVWQRRHLAGALLESELAWWRGELAGLPPAMEMPADHPRAADRSERGAVHGFAIGDLEGLTELSRRHRATLFMTLLAGLAGLLRRWTGESDLAVGTPTAGRLRTETEPLIGLFINILPLRVDLSGAPSFAEVLARVRPATLAAFAHQEVPFERLVEELAPERDRSRTPIFQVMLALQNNGVEPLALPGLDVEAHPLSTGTAKFELNFVLSETAQGLTGEIEYARDLFDRPTIARLADGFTRLLAEAVADPERRLMELPLLSLEERHQLLVEWNDTRAPFPEMTLLHQFFEASVERAPEAIAAVCSGQELTYAELEARSNRLANLLRERGVVRGTPVGVWVERSFDMLTAILGVLKAGGHYVALDEAWPADRVETILGRTGAPAIVVGPGLLGAVDEMRWRLPALSDAVCLGLSDPEPPPEAIDPESVRALWDFVAERAVDRVTAGGFISAFTGEPMNDAEVDEYRDRVLSLASPWLRPDARVLEIGNGSGLLLWEMAARVKHVTGIDPSSLTQERNREHAEREGIGNVELLTGFAHEVDGLVGDERFDLILLASTVQFFPGPRYLERVVRWAQGRLAPGGAVLVADVLDARRREELRRAIEEAGRDAGARRQELFLDEDLFRDLDGSVHHRTAGFPNELRFRYDVLLTPGQAVERRKRLWTHWHVERCSEARLPQVAAPDDLAYIIHTSGSTGEPKGIAVQHRPAANLVDWINRTFEIGPEDRGLFVTSLCFDLSVYDVFGVLGAGGTVHVATREELSDPDHLVELLRTGGITLWDSAPAALVQLAPLFPAAPETGSRLRRVLLSGDWIPVTLPDRVRQSFPGAQVMALGGATEATVWSNWFPVGAVDPEWPSIPYGRPIANARYHVLDDAFAPCPIGVPGDLFIGGDCLCAGYARRPELTAQAFLPDPFSETPGARIYRTGDRSRYLVDGNLEFLGRLDHQVKVRGYRIELGEIEVALSRHPGVREAVVLVRRLDQNTEPGDRRLVAYVVPAGDPPEDLRDVLRQSLPEYMIPSAFVMLGELPVTANGKLDRAALPAPQWRAGSEVAPPQTPAEEMLAAIWSSVLGVSQVGREDSFFDLGGHSLLATQMVSRIREACGVDLSLRTLFERPKLADLAAWIEPSMQLSDDRESAIERVPRTEPLVLSFAQQRLWFLDQMEPGSPLYNIAAGVELRGRLDRPALEGAFAEVVRRHEALRTTFRVAGAEPVQAVAESAGFTLPLIDLQGLPERERGEESSRLAAVEAAQPFDLREGPLLRAVLLRQEPERHRLLLVVHHIVSDGWSMGVLIRELGALYAFFLEGGQSGRPSPLPELPIQYADFAAWQRRSLAGESLEAEVAWWRERLAGLPPALELPVDHPRPAVRSARGALHGFAIGREGLAGLTELSLRHGATLFMTLLAGLAVLLQRVSGGPDDLAVGTPIAGRTRTETEGLIGFFVNTLALRVDLSGAPAFLELLDRVRETTLAAYAHQEMPFERLVEELAPERDRSRTPLFQLMLALQNAAREPLSLPGLELEAAALPTGTAKFDLTFVLSETAQGLAGEIEYSRDLFEPASIERLAGRFLRLLAGAVADPQAPLPDLPVLSAAEIQQVLVEHNETRTAYPREACLQELFAQVARAMPDAEAIVSGSEIWTYRRLDEASSRLARRLQDLGVGIGTPVCLSLERSPELIAGILAVVKAGGVYVPIDAGYPDERLSFLLDDAGADVVLVHAATRERLEGLGRRVVAIDEVLPEGGAPLPARVPAESLAYVLYTSGSTGRPKGVAVPHRAIVRLVRDTNYVRLGPGDRTGQIANISFDAATYEIWGALLNGGAVAVIPRETVLSPVELAAVLRRQRVTSMFMTVALFTKVSREVPDAFQGLSELLVGGEAVDPVAARAVLAAGPPRRLLNGYGPTESTTFASWYPIREVPPGTAGIPIGSPVANTSLYVLDRWQAPVPPGAVGELCIGGDGLAWGYWNRPELTAERFVPDPVGDRTDRSDRTDPSDQGRAGHRLYRTGDLVRRRPDGAIEFLGRIDQQVKIRGFRVEPGEIEAALLEHPAVRQAAVVLLGGSSDDRRLAAFVEGNVTASELRRLLEDKLPAYMVPSFLTVLPAMPLTSSGKIDRKALLALETESAPQEPAAPLSQVEELVAGIFAEVLQAERVDPGASFFALGGHSLLAAQVAARVRQVLGVELPLRVLFDAPTVAGLAAEIEKVRTGESQAAPPVRVERSGPLPLSFAQERLWFLQQLEPGSATYNMPVAVEMTGPLDRGAFAAAWAEIVRRQESLRTTFPEVDGAPRQRIAPAARVPLPLADLSALPAAAGLGEAERLEREQERQGFDLERGPLVRVLLVRLAAERHRFLLSLHHMISDGWSLGVLVRELGALYGAFRERRPSPLPELPVQVADFAVWQRGQLAGRQSTELAYWESRLGGEIAAAELPTDRPRPAVQTFRGGRRQLVLPPELTARLKSFGRGEGVTLFMTLLAALQTLLFRHSGEPDVAVGAPVAGRSWVETEGLIGCFLNTLVLRTDLSDGPSFRELAARVRTVTLEAYSHQDVPFEAVLARLRLDRDLSRTPLFQVLFNLLSLPPPDMALPGLGLRVLTPAEVPSKLDMTFYISEAEASVWINLVYNADLFEEARMADLLEQLRLLLELGIEQPERPVDSLPLLTAAARALLPDPSEVLPEPVFPPVAQLFLDRAQVVPDEPALCWSGGSWTYAQLAARAREIASAAASAGAGPGVVAAVFGSRSPELIASLLGVFLSGAALLILDRKLPAARLRLMVEEAKRGCLIYLGEPREEDGWVWEREGGLILSDRTDRSDPSDRSNPALPLPAPDDPAYVFFTSGTTGRPKAVLGRQRGLSHFLSWQSRTFGIGPGDRAAQLTGLSFDVVLRDILMPLVSGAALVLPEEDDLSPDRILLWLQENAVTVVHTVPSLASAWLSFASMGSTSMGSTALRWTFFAGEPLPGRVVERWRAAFPCTGVVNLYGPTETTLAKCFYEVPDPVRGDVQPVGAPIPQTQALVLANGSRRCGIGEVGEIVIRTPFRSLGYLNHPEESRLRFRPNPFRDAPGDLLYFTGDRGRYRRDGTLEILGRLDDQVKIRGVRVEPAEVRAALGRCPGVWESAVMAREVRPGDHRLVAYVVPRPDGPGFPLDPEALRRQLRQELPEALVPSTFVVLAALPLTPNGKVDRRALARIEVEIPSSSGEARELRTPVEEIVAGLWAEVLGVPRVGPDDSFFQLGGHSLTGAQMVSRLRETFRVELPLRVLFEAPTVAALSAEVERRRRGDYAPDHPSIASFRQDRSAPSPLSFAQERFWAGRHAEARSVASTIPMLFLLDGDLDLPCLRRALQEIVDRHEVMRTCFREEAGEPVQVVLPVVRIELPVIDLGPVRTLEQREEIGHWSNFEAQRHFDFERGPLFRLTLFRCAERRHLLLFVVHHIAFDGWSRSVLLGELAALYDAFRAGLPSPLPPLSTQYQDFARWQRHRLQGETLEREVGFWRDQLRGATPVRLGDRVQLADPTFEAGIEVFTVPEELERRLEAFAAEQCATLFMTLLAAFKALLHAESGRDDVVVTSLFANRDQLETEGLIGNFFAGLPLRTRLAGACTFRDLVARVRDVTLAALEHPDILYEPVMEGLSFLEPGERGGIATFRIMFQLGKFPPAEQALSGLTLVRVPFDTGKMRQDLTLFFSQSDRLVGRFKYNRGVLDAEKVIRLRDRLLQILSKVVEDPGCPLLEILEPLEEGSVPRVPLSEVAL